MRKKKANASAWLHGFRTLFPLALMLWFAQAGVSVLQAQQVVDRVVARVEDDIITLSEVRELGRYQQLVEGRAAAEKELLRQLIEQWIVVNEATASQFARPSTEDVARETARLEKLFASPSAYQARLRELGLRADAVRRIVAQQLYLARYLDYKFRPAAQVDAPEVEKYFNEELAPKLRARGQAVPPLGEVEEQIRELLTQRDISQRAGRWLEETRGRLRIEIMSGGELK